MGTPYILLSSCLAKWIRKLSGEAERNLQLEYHSVQFIICDEYSMVGCRLLNAVNARCQQAKAVYNHPFGNMFVYLVGDIKQLPPVQDSAVYMPPPASASAETLNGKSLFASFQCCVFLSVSQRQTPAEQDFRDILDRISCNASTAEDHSKLMTRPAAVIPDYEANWKDVLRLFPTNEKVDEYNLQKLAALHKPVAKIEAAHNHNIAKTASPDVAQGLEPVIRLAIGCRVMLRINLWTEKGLVNGALGTVCDIFYEAGTRPPTDMPVVMIRLVFTVVDL